MSSEMKHLRAFGKFRLDADKKMLWFENELVNLPLKEIELLCVLTEKGGEVITKGELLERVWAESFVEESNLSRHIYLLRKTFKDFGESEELIQTVPRRGYRFASEIRACENGNGTSELVIAKHSLTQTLIEEIDPEQTVESPLASQNLKPAEKPSRLRISGIKIYVLAAVVAVMVISSFAFLRDRSPQASPVSGIKSLAVLPFKTLGASGDSPHQGLGLADILITRLSNIKAVNIRPTSAVMMFENQQQDSLSLGQKLQVDAILEGTIYRTSDKVRVTARLIKLSDQTTLWTGEFEKIAQDEMKIQSEIATQVTDALAINFSADEKQATAKRYTENAEAYELYLKGRYHWNKRDNAGLMEAERLFRNAIEKDPNFALAYVGLADKLMFLQQTDEANYDVKKALELDPNLAEVYASRGFIMMFHYWDWQKAEADFQKALDLNPGYAPAHQWYATLLMVQNRCPEAEAELTRALEINPLSYNLLADLGQAYLYARQYEKAEAACLKALEIYPEFIFAHGHLAEIYFLTGEHEKAIHELAIQINILTTAPYQPIDIKLGIESIRKPGLDAWQSGGIKGFWRYQLEVLQKTKNPNANKYLNFARTYLALGEKEKALDYLEKAREEKAFLMPFINVDAVYDGLRSEPRFQEILRKMNLE
jgi:DNA-binding winged helix-turn-helix (wHTH) protein/TolB-like protein